jgi:ATP-dependent Clp protease ATP-binding subunit ClpB
MDFLTKGAEYLARYEDFRLVGRDQELKRLTSVLMRNYANSVILVGAGGVGCTTICVGIQAAKTLPDAPFDIINKRLFWLDSDGLFSSGNTEETNHAFHRIITRLNEIDEAILIVEDTRDFIEACRNNNTMHFINALLVAVRNGRTQVIFETKDDDLDSILKSHSDMRELFTILPVDEPTGEALVAIVTAAATVLAKHHGVEVTKDAIDAAIEFTNRYHTRDPGLSRAQPERSITLLDRALAAYRLTAHRKPPQYSDEEWAAKQAQMRHLNADRRDGENVVTDYQDQIDSILKHEKEAAASPDGRPQVFDGGGFQAPAITELKSKIARVNAEVRKLKEQITTLTAEINSGLSLIRAMVLREFSDISGIAADKLDQDVKAKLRGLETDIKKRIFGQDEAVKKVADGIRVARVGRRNGDRPVPFLFLGPSGVGKTEVAKVLASIVLDDEGALSRFDMSEYMEKHAVAKMIGAPPGYEGFEAGGILTNLMRRSSNRVLLFDEIEKAHDDIFNVFLQVLSDGRLTDNVGRTVSFDGAITIFTTNIGQTHFLNPNLTDAEAESLAIEELNNRYRSEFLNRFNGRQNIYCFKKLDLPSMEKIVRREITSLDNVYGPQGIHVEALPEAISQFCADQYDPRIGARGLPGFITANLEPFLVNSILEDEDTKGTAQVTYSNENKRFDVKMAA